MSQYETQEELDKAISQIKDYSNEQLVDRLCEAWHRYCRLTERMELEQARSASEDYQMMRSELARRGIL